jgi:hypothetical protein
MRIGREQVLFGRLPIHHFIDSRKQENNAYAYSPDKGNEDLKSIHIAPSLKFIFT